MCGERQRLIVPQVSAVWSADPSQRWSFPARFLAEFFQNHGVLSVRGRPRWLTIRGGSARYVEALIRPFAVRLRLGAPVESVVKTWTSGPQLTDCTKRSIGTSKGR